MKTIAIKPATPADVPVVVGFIQKKAEFDRELGCFDGKLATTPERIAKALFGDPVFAYAIIATEAELPVGFAFYHFHFSSFQARSSLWLDDLYVDTDARRSGAGIRLMGALATIALKHDCTHIGWIAAANNPSGIPFYTKIGAMLISQQGLGYTYSIAPDALAARASAIETGPNKAPPRVTPPPPAVGYPARPRGRAP